MFGWETLLLIVIILLILYFHYERKASYWHRRGVNGPKALPLIGNLLDSCRLAQNELEEHRLKTYGRVHGIMLGTSPVLTVGDPDLLKQIMITDFHVFMNHRRNFAKGSFLNRMLSELEDDEWRRVRAIISRAFTTSKLKRMEPLFERCTKNTFNYLDLAEKRKEEIDIKKTTSAYAMDISASCMFGMNTNVSKNANDKFAVKTRGIIDFPLWRMLCRFTLPDTWQEKYDLAIFPQKNVKYLKTILKEVLRKGREFKNDYVNFVTLLLDAEYQEDENDKENEKHQWKFDKVKLTEDDIMSNCLLFLIGGTDTSATFLQFTLYALAMNPEIQQKLFEEINEYFNVNEKIEFDSLSTLPYFDAVCNESLRLYSPVTVIEHICGKYYRLGDIEIEKGVVVNLPIFAIHRDPELFPNPYEFLPERFMPENSEKIKPYSFIPFALGPRMCVGRRFSNIHSKLFLAKFIKNYEIIKTKNTPENPKYNGRFLVLSCEPMCVAIRRRNR